jgi:hypothetical protein
MAAAPIMMASALLISCPRLIGLPCAVSREA